MHPETLEILDYHVAGEPLRIILPMRAIAGATMAEKAEAAYSLLHPVRRLATAEPRAHRDTFAAFLTDPVSEGSHLGALFCDGEIDSPYKGACGHGAIALAAAALNEGWIPPHDGANTVHIDVPAGRVTLSVDWADGRAGKIVYRHVPSRVLDMQKSYPSALGPITGALVMAGPEVLLVDAAAHGIAPELPAAFEAYQAIRVAAEKNAIAAPDLVQFRWAGSGNLEFRSVAFFGSSSFDRSPCGTATSALVTYLAATGTLGADQTLTNRTLWDTAFTAGIAGHDTSAPLADGFFRAEIHARAFATGRTQVVIDPEDTIGEGLPLLTIM